MSYSVKDKSAGNGFPQNYNVGGRAGSPLHAARLPTDAFGFAMTFVQGSFGGRWLRQLLRVRFCDDGAHGGLGRRPRALPRLGMAGRVIEFGGVENRIA